MGLSYTRLTFIAGAFVLATPVAFAAGSGDHSHGHGSDHAMGEGAMAQPGTGLMSGAMSGPMSFGKPGDAAKADRTVEIVMDDNFFELETLKVAAGETIQFNVTNRGTLVHEFNLGTPDYHESHQAEMVMMQQHGVLMGNAINHDMMNMPMGDDGHTMSHDHPNSVLLEPGETGDVTWTFTSGGDIEFACNVPGHYAAGMVGTVNVE